MPLNDSNSLDYWNNAQPKCPHCDEDIVIGDHELYNLYEEDTHDVTCPHCEKDFIVRSQATYTFSTDEQDNY